MKFEMNTQMKILADTILISSQFLWYDMLLAKQINKLIKYQK